MYIYIYVLQELLKKYKLNLDIPALVRLPQLPVWPCTVRQWSTCFYLTGLEHPNVSIQLARFPVAGYYQTNQCFKSPMAFI